MNVSIRNIFTNPLTVREQAADTDIKRLRLAILVQDVAAAMGKAVAAVSSDDIFDYNGPDWPYRPMRPAPEPDWPQPSIDLITLEGDDDE